MQVVERVHAPGNNESSSGYVGPKVDRDRLTLRIQWGMPGQGEISEAGEQHGKQDSRIEKHAAGRQEPVSLYQYLSQRAQRRIQ
jgi:hypothetical protein